MSIIDNVKSYIFTIGLKKALKRIAYIIATWLTANQIASDTPLTPEQTTALLYGLWEFVRNWLKHKYPEKFDWL